MLSSVPCVTSFKMFSDKMGSMINENEKVMVCVGREGPSGLAMGTRSETETSASSVEPCGIETEKPEGKERSAATAEEVLGKRGRRPRSDTAVRRLTPEQQAK